MKDHLYLIVLRFATCIISHMISPSLQSSTASHPGITGESLESLTSSILTRYFEDDCLLAFLSSSDNNFQFGCGQYSIVTVEKFDGNDEDKYVREVLAPSMEIGCPGHVIQTEDPRRQLSLIERTYVKVWQRVQRIFLILPLVVDRQINGTNRRFVRGETEYLRDVFSSKSIKYVPNLVVVIPTDENELALYTHQFGGPGDSFKQLVLLDVFSPKTNAFRNGGDLFPDKTVDLKGRVLIASVPEYVPYVAIDHKTGDLFGTGWNVVIEFCQRHNCVLEPLIDNVDLFGEIFDNGTGNGVLGNVVEDRADVCFGSLFMWHHEWLFLDLGSAYIRTAVTCLVPRPRLLAQWATPIRPFDGILWCAVIAAVLLDALTIYLVYAVANWIRRNSRQSFMTPVTACLTAVGLSVEQSLKIDVTGSSRRILVFGILLVSLVISTSYGSGLSSILTVPRFEKPIDTAQDLEASGIQWSAPHDAWVFSLYGSNESLDLNLIDQFLILPPDEITKKAYEADMGFAIERLQGGNYAIQDYLPAKAVANLRVMTGHVYWAYAVSMLKKSSPFTERWIALELDLLASGIPSYWEDVTVMLSLDRETQYNVRHVVLSNEPVQLNVAQIQGAFLFLCFGLTFAAVIFACEISARHFRRFLL